MKIEFVMTTFDSKGTSMRVAPGHHSEEDVEVRVVHEALHPGLLGLVHGVILREVLLLVHRLALLTQVELSEGASAALQKAFTSILVVSLFKSIY